MAERHGYDAAGRRLWTWDGSSGTNWFVYDGVHVVADLNEAGGMVRSYVWGPGIDNLLSMTSYGASTNTYYALKDHLGSVLAMTDASGNIVESYKYDAWGRTTSYGSSGGELNSSAIGNRYCWQGREYSFRTGFYYFRARWADPVTGRWLSNDPIGISGGLNQYVFCGNNPVSFTDPFGLCERRAVDDLIDLHEGGQFFLEDADKARDRYMNDLLKRIDYSSMIPAGAGIKISKNVITAAIIKIENILAHSGNEKHIAAAVRDLIGNPVRKSALEFWDHSTEVKEALNGLRKQVGKLSDSLEPASKVARERALKAIRAIENAIKGAGI